MEISNRIKLYIWYFLSRMGKHELRNKIFMRWLGSTLIIEKPSVEIEEEKKEISVLLRKFFKFRKFTIITKAIFYGEMGKFVFKETFYPIIVYKGDTLTLTIRLRFFRGKKWKSKH
jgi:hypothetical protein